MKLVVDIPEKDIPSRQEIMTIDLHFIDGTVCAASYPCEKLPKGHGRLVDMSEVIVKLMQYYDREKTIGQCLNEVPTVIEADGGNEE